DSATTTRFWWVRHAPVESGGRIYGQEDMPCDCSETAVFSGLARQLPRDAVWVTSNLRRTHETARAIVRAGLPGPALIPGPRAALVLALGLEPEACLAFTMENCSLTRIDHIDGPGMGHGWRVVAVNRLPR